jgi:DNA-binding response OmpR family regulator
MAKRVLLAEDEPNILESLIFLLERAGFDVVSGMNGQAALGAALVDGRPQGAGAPAKHP